MPAILGQAILGLDALGVGALPLVVNSPASWFPAYSALAGPPASRGGPPGSLDLDVRTGGLGRDALGNPGLVAGGDRVVGAIVRALLTPRGSNLFDPRYGSVALPGQPVVKGLLLQVADAVHYELRRGSRIFGGSVRVDAEQMAGDLRQFLVTVQVTTAAGPQALTFPVAAPGL